MIVTVAQGLVVVVGLWLFGVGVWMVARPGRALLVLGRMGSSPVIHFGEMALRGTAGIALVLAAPASRFPAAIIVIGGFLIVTALMLSALPRRWHAAYSTWWARRIPMVAVRSFGPVSVLAGGMLIWTMTGC